MLLLIITTLVAFIILPLLELITAERIKTLAKIVVLAVTALWEVYVLFVGKVGV